MLPSCPQGGTAEVSLKVGHVLKLSIEDKYKEIGDENVIYVDYMNIVKVCVPGDLVYVDDGLISLKVTDRNSTSLTTGAYTCTVEPPNEGHFGDNINSAVLSLVREVALFSEVLSV